MNVRSFVAWCTRDGAGNAKSSRAAPEHGWHSHDLGDISVWYAPRDRRPAVSAPGAVSLMLGDGSEQDGASTNLAHGVPVRYDENARELVIHTSIVALPPIFLYRGATVTAVTSDLYALRDVPGIRLQLDPRAVGELGWFGHPVAHRTLFRDVEIVPAAARLRFGPRVPKHAEFARSWTFRDAERLDWPEFIEAQIDAFRRRVKQLDVDGRFLSLTAGLDTRTVFAELASEGRLVSGATMTGAHRSLDARVAARLCEAYGVGHQPVTLDERFTRDLPKFVQQASVLSGGLASVGQAPEVFMYDQLGDSFIGRISGNLGNQVGRGGTEGVSLRGASAAILSPDLRAHTPSGHWLLEELDRGERATLELILHREIPFTLVSNFTIGNHFAMQQTPYASRSLIETLALRPLAGSRGPSGSKLRMRMRDLRHRFLGEPRDRSFQRTLVARIGGFAARCPVNWGWRPSGGVDAGGLALGAATLAGMFARAKGLDAGVLRRPLAWTGLASLHDFRESRSWLRRHLRDFTMDTVRAAPARLFERPALDRMLDEHFRGAHDHYETVTFALDVALAHQEFCR